MILSMGYFISLVGSSFFSSRFSHRQTVLVSGGALGAALIGVSFSRNPVVMRLVLFLVGVGGGLYLPSAIVIITTTFQGRHWGKAIAVHELAPNIGFVAAPLISEVLMQHFSWRAPFFVLGLMSLALAGVFLGFGRDGDFSGTPPGMESFKAIFSNASFWRLILLFALGIAGTLGLFAMLPVFLVAEHGFDHRTANTVVALSRLAGAVVVFWSGWLADRLGAKRVLTLVFLLSGLATMAMGISSSTHVIFPIFIQSVISVCFFPAGFAILSRVSRPDLRNMMVSLTIPAAFVAGGGLIPAFIGAVGEIASFKSAFFLVGVFIGMGALFSRRVSTMHPPL